MIVQLAGRQQSQTLLQLTCFSSLVKLEFVGGDDDGSDGGADEDDVVVVTLPANSEKI